MADKYAGWTEEPADEHAGWTEEPVATESAPVVPPSRLARLAEVIRSAPQAMRDMQLAPLRMVMNPAAELSPQGQTGAAVRGFGHGASFGLTDELRGVSGAVDEIGARFSPFESRSIEQTRPSQSFMDAVSGRYREDRNAARHEEDQAGNTHPLVHGGAEIGGMIATPNPFSKLAAAGRAGRLASAAGQGELYAGGSSRASDAGGIAKDVATGGGVGLMAGAAAEPVGALARWFSGLKNKGAAATGAKVGSDAAKDFASERGRLGGVTSGTETDFVTAEKIIASPIAPPELKARAQAIIDSDMGKQTRLSAWENTLDRIPSRLGQIGEARGAMEAASAATEPAAVAAATQARLDQSVLKTQILPRVDRLARSAIPGLTPGGAFAQATGAPVTTVNNLLKAPEFQHRVGQIGEAMTKPVAGAAEKAGGLSEYLMSDEDREEEAAANYTKKMGGR